MTGFLVCRHSSSAMACGSSWQALAHPYGVSRWQKIGTQVFSPDRVGFCFLEVLAPIVAIGGHRKPETNNQGKQRQRSRKDLA
ncbi:hypothetical protein [Bradyrhizobium ganzhouense]|uniref:hypothetical protein n=1 Tax=Bradyrhizobium ganzhouense TaxID=1179767 RepID=UPI003CE9FD75